MRSEPPVTAPARGRGRRRWRGVLPATALVAATSLVAGDVAGAMAGTQGGTGSASARGTAAVGSAGSTRPCGTLGYHRSHPPRYRHVVVIMNENTSPSELTADRAPFLTRLRKQCGSEGSMHAATHYSDPNYLAVTSGHPREMGSMSRSDNIFHQVQRAGRRWTSYQQSMTRSCGPNVTPYSTWHDPAHWYSDLRSPRNTCATRDVPLYPRLSRDLRRDALPAFAWITPDECHNMHWSTGCAGSADRAIPIGDAWLEKKVSQLVSRPSYRAGRTLVIITWDEGDGHSTRGADCTDPAVYRQQASCLIPTFVLSPYVVPGARDTSDQNLYSLLGTVEDVLRVPRLGRAVGQPSLRPGLRF